MVTNTTGGSVLADRLVAHGVSTIFALSGAGHTHLLLPLEDRGVRIVGTRHETGAVGAADGYARVTRQIGVAAIIAEQGLPNAITAIATACRFGSPVVVLVTRFPDDWDEASGEFAIDHHALLTPISKWVRTVPAVDRLADYFDTACRMAQEGRPGPAILVIPQNVLGTPVQPAPPSPIHVPAALPSADPAAIETLADLVSAAARPVILTDSGCSGPVAAEALRVLNTRFDLPVFGYGTARGLIPEDGETVLSWPFGQIALPTVDLAIVLGARLNIWFGFGRAPRFPESLKVVQIDVQAENIGRNRPVTLGIIADPGQALGQLALSLERRAMKPADTTWLDEALGPRRAAIAEIRARTAEPIHALNLAAELEVLRPKGGVFVADGADILNWSHGVGQIVRAPGYLDHHPLGSMGMGLPLAIGAAAGERDLAQRENRPVQATTLLTGDGAIGFYIAELDTIRREALPLKIIVANDGLWGTEFHGQMLVTGRFINTKLGQSDYATVAEGFGIASVAVDKYAELSASLDDAFANDQPRLIDVRIDPEAGIALKRDARLSFLKFNDLAPIKPS